MTPHRKTVILFGATGTIGRATALALCAAGHDLRCYLRPNADAAGLPPGAAVIRGSITDIDAKTLTGCDVVVSCLASRTGTPADAWAIDHDAHQHILGCAQQAGVGQFVLLSAICVQKPKLAFQRAKLAFEASLQDSGLRYSIVRPTAFFKSLSGQVARVQSGKPFLVFGDGTLTACKPISDRDLARYIATCVTEPERWNRVLPIGGPGPAITPLDQVGILSTLLGRDVPVKRVPLWLMSGIIGALRLGGMVSPSLRDKSELAKIGRYYATEAMLVWNGEGYDAAATPSYGSDTLTDHYRDLIAGDVAAELGDHAVF